jgi:hypothetical protein
LDRFLLSRAEGVETEVSIEIRRERHGCSITMIQLVRLYTLKTKFTLPNGQGELDLKKLLHNGRSEFIPVNLISTPLGSL